MSADFYERHLRPFPPIDPVLDPEHIEFFGSLAGLLRAVESLCPDCRLSFVRAGGTLPKSKIGQFPVRITGGKVVGHVVLENNKENQVHKENQRLAKSLSEFLGESYLWQRVAREQEAVLAALGDESKLPRAAGSFADHLKRQLQNIVRILNCCAASLYTLTGNNKRLKLRSVWGIPEDRLVSPPRLLHDSLGDAEALLGQAVIANAPFLVEEWRCPEHFPVAVCVPVATFWSSLGTLWLYSDVEGHCFEERELRILDIAAGRLAMELSTKRAAIMDTDDTVRRVA